MPVEEFVLPEADELSRRLEAENDNGVLAMFRPAVARLAGRSFTAQGFVLERLPRTWDDELTAAAILIRALAYLGDALTVARRTRRCTAGPSPARAGGAFIGGQRGGASRWRARGAA